MRLLIHDYAGHPFQVQLSRELANRNHQVLHLFAGYNQTPRGFLLNMTSDPVMFNVDGVYIKKPLQKDAFILRWLQEREYGHCMIDEVRTYQPDLVISANTPLDAQKAILSETRRQKAAFIFWLHDFIGIAAHSILSKKLPIAGNLIGGHYKRLERNLLRRSDAIVAITEDFCPTLRSWGISENKVEVIPNWAPLEELPVSAKKNSWSREHGLDEGFNFLYTGTLRMKHDPAILIELATSVNHDEQSARVVVTSEGPGAEWLRDQASLLGLKNFKILNFQPMEQYSEVLASSDVLIAILEKEAGAFSVPSKVLSYLCAKRPLLLAIPKENLAAKIIESNKAGIVVEPDDFDAFTQGAQTLISSPDLRDEMGENARKYAEASFDINSIADRFEEIIVSL